MEVAYVGNKGTKLTDGPLGHQFNQLTADSLRLGTQLQQLVTNPFQPFRHRRAPLSRPTITRGQLLRPYPQFLDSTTSVRHRAHRPIMRSRLGWTSALPTDLTLLASFTGGKLIEDTSQTVGFLGPAPAHQDIYNRRASRSLASQDVSRRLVISYIYDLPFGRGKALGESLPPAVDYLIGGWQMNGILTFSTGVPLAITTRRTTASRSRRRCGRTSLARSESSRAAVRPMRSWPAGSTPVCSASRLLSLSATVRASCRMCGATASEFWDFSVFKTFPIREAIRFEFRAEFFNFANHPLFGAPGEVFGNAQFGVVNAQANSPRQVQLGLKLYF